LPQQVLTDFIVEGHFERHLRRMRARYAARQTALVEALAATFGDQVQFDAPDAGMHLTVYLRGELARIGDIRLADAAREAGIGVYALSRYYVGPPGPPGLMIGYAAHTEVDIRAGLTRLPSVARAAADSSP